MTIHINELIDCLALFCEQKNLRASAAAALKGGLMTGIAAFMGGLLLGPVGLAIGGSIGGISSAIAAKNLQPVCKILRNMPCEFKRKLSDRFVAAFRDFEINDIAKMSLMLASSRPFQEIALTELQNFLCNEMNMRMLS